MSVAELKLAIIEQVNQIDDEELLKAISISVGSFTSENEYVLSDLQKNLLQASVE